MTDEQLKERVLAIIVSFGGAIILGAIMRDLSLPPVIEKKQVQKALRSLAKEKKVYCVLSRYWAPWRN